MVKIEFILSADALLNLHDKVMSSPKSVNLKKVVHLEKSLIKTGNNNGPTSEPCETPRRI